MGICTPLGVSHLFTVLGALITSPKVHPLTYHTQQLSHPHTLTQPTTNVEEELEDLRCEEMRRVRLETEGGGEEVRVQGRGGENGMGVMGKMTLDEVQHRKAQLGQFVTCEHTCRGQSSSLAAPIVERHLNSSPWERHVLYPLTFLGLLGVTLLALLLVAVNSALLVLYPDR